MTETNIRFVVREGKYAMDDQGRYYAMTDGQTSRPILSGAQFKEGNVPVPISIDNVPSTLLDKVRAEVVRGVPGQEYPVRVDHTDQDGDPFFVYEMDREQNVRRLRPKTGKWQGTGQNSVKLVDLPIDVYKALIGE